MCEGLTLPPLAGRGAPCNARARDVGAQPRAALAARDTWGLSRPGCAPLAWEGSRVGRWGNSQP